MPIADRTSIAIPQILWLTLTGASAGAAYNYVSLTAGGGPQSPVRSIGVLSSFDAFVLESRTGAPLGRAPFLLHLGLKSLVYLVFLLGIAAGQWLLPIPSSPGVHIGRYDILFCFAVGFAANFLLAVDGLPGQNVLLIS
jgi:hypothetical protein